MTMKSKDKTDARDIQRRTGWKYGEALFLVQHLGHAAISKALDEAPTAAWGAIRLALSGKAREAQRAASAAQK